MVLSHSRLLKLTHLWRLPLLRNPGTWKRSIIQRFWHKWSFIIWNCHCESDSVADDSENIPRWDEEAPNKRFTVTVNGCVWRHSCWIFHTNEHKMKLLTQNQGFPLNWQPTRNKMMKVKESASISQFVSVPLEEAWLWSAAFVNSQNLYLWTLFRRSVRWDILEQNDTKSFRFGHYSHGPRPWNGL